MKYCGWNAFKHGATKYVDTDRIGGSLTYDKYCTDYSLFCDMRGEGIKWHTLNVASIAIIAVSIVCVFGAAFGKTIYGYSKVVQICTVLLIIISSIISGWNYYQYHEGNNNTLACVNSACGFINNYGTSEPLDFECDSSMGGSIKWMMVTFYCNVAAALLMSGHFIFQCRRKRKIWTGNKQHQGSQVVSHHPIQSELVQTTPINLNQSLLSQNEEMFACAGACGKTLKHDDRTRSERDSGAIEIYCEHCKQQKASKCGEGVKKLDMVLIIMWAIVIFIGIFVVCLMEDKTMFTIVEVPFILFIIFGLVKDAFPLRVFGFIWSGLNFLFLLFLSVIMQGDVLPTLASMYFAIIVALSTKQFKGKRPWTYFLGLLMVYGVHCYIICLQTIRYLNTKYTVSDCFIVQFCRIGVG